MEEELETDALNIGAKRQHKPRKLTIRKVKGGI